MKVLAIDPGNIESAYVLMDGYKPLEFGKVPNDQMIRIMYEKSFDPDGPFDCSEDLLPQDTPPHLYVAIEMIASYGMPVGREVFDTCVWIGRFSQIAISNGLPVDYVYRADEKLNLCGSSRAKDANVRQALIDRFAQRDFKNGKGVKANPDFFYGFRSDVWAAYAVGVTWMDKHIKEA